MLLPSYLPDPKASLAGMCDMAPCRAQTRLLEQSLRLERKRLGKERNTDSPEVSPSPQRLASGVGLTTPLVQLPSALWALQMGRAEEMFWKDLQQGLSTGASAIRTGFREQ